MVMGRSGRQSGPLVVSRASLTRTADGNIYAANDVIANAVSGAVITRIPDVFDKLGGRGLIVGALLRTNQVACVAQIEVHLYSASVTMLQDNTPFTALDANDAVRLKSLEFPALSTKGSGSDIALAALAVGDIGVPLPVFSPTTDLYAIFMTKTVFTPASGQIFRLTLHTLMIP